MKLQGYKHRTSVCPGCGQLINATVDPKQRGCPRAGDLTICEGCGTILVFDAVFNLAAATPEQLEALPSKTVEELREHQERWRARQSKSQSRIIVP